jgi:hypothetical protein
MLEFRIRGTGNATAARHRIARGALRNDIEENNRLIGPKRVDARYMS